MGVHPVCDIEVESTHTFIANGLASTNCQDMEKGHIPILREIISHSPLELERFFGTPKTLDNTIQVYWNRSSQAEWVIECHNAGCPDRWNVPAADYHIEKMIGPLRDDISDKAPAVICHACGRPLNPRPRTQGGFGEWIHRRPQLADVFPGYHIPRVVMPLHYGSKDKWAELLAKQQGQGNTTINMFYNEVLGESYDRALKLVTETDLKKVSTGEKALGPNSLENAKRLRSKCRFWVLAVDWGGGGEEETSFTTAALVGLTWQGEVIVPWGMRSLIPHDQFAEAEILLKIWDEFQPHVFAHDYTGAGDTRIAIMAHMGLPEDRIANVQYTGPAKGRVCKFEPPTENNPWPRHKVDKARAIATVCQVIKLTGMRFFDFDFVSDEDPGLIYDFVSLVEEKVKTKGAGELYRIGCAAGSHDDFAQSVTIGTTIAWHANKTWPDYRKLLAKYNLDEQTRDAVDGPKD